MSNLCIIPARALRDPTLKGTDIRVLCAIGLHVGRDGSGCFALTRTLCKEAGVHRSQFFASTHRLIAAGLITRESGQAAGKGSRYAIIFDSEGESIKRGRGVHDVGTAASTIPVRRSPRKQDGASINAPFNVPPNDGAVDLDAEGRTLFSQIRRQRVEVRSPNGSHYRIPQDVIANLSPRVRGVIEVIGGPSAIAGADDDTALRVLRGEFAKVYAASSRERTA